MFYSVFPAVVGTVLWIEEADAAATLFVFPWKRLRKLLSFLLKAPEFEKLLGTQLRPRYEAHWDTVLASELIRRPLKPVVPKMVGTFTK
jgi:hypothetical protein